MTRLKFWYVYIIPGCIFSFSAALLNPQILSRIYIAGPLSRLVSHTLRAPVGSSIDSESIRWYEPRPNKTALRR